MDVTLTMPTGEPESGVADHIEIRVRDSRIDTGEYGIANEYVFGTLYISSQTNELRFWADAPHRWHGSPLCQRPADKWANDPVRVAMAGEDEVAMADTDDAENAKAKHAVREVAMAQTTHAENAQAHPGQGDTLKEA